jgi:deoxyribodipyrimidine photo-lyase
MSGMSTDSLDDPQSLATDAWVATRDEGLRRLDAFLPRAGRRYAETRNHDLGPADRRNVSTLSPWIRHRLIREDEVVGAVLRRHAYSSAEKFIQEVAWRTYWKGWLEMRPAVWRDYRHAAGAWLAELECQPSLRDRWEAAKTGRTGIACFDAWARELVDLGYLHNHTRMWFASIWIFTLGLPWELGADFFLRHLMDGDPASNTLSWRWVAGLQTPGKTYLARADNIARYTGGRFPSTPGLAGTAPALDGVPAPAPSPLPPPGRLDPEAPTALLVTEDDGHLESLPIRPVNVRGVAGAVCTGERSPLGAGPRAVAFARGAVEDAVARLRPETASPAPLVVGDWTDGLVDWARSLDVRQVVTGYAPVGPVRERLDELASSLAEHGIALVRVRRTWDEVLWPHASRGFFAFKDKLPAALADLGLLRSKPAAVP